MQTQRSAEYADEATLGEAIVSVLADFKDSASTVSVIVSDAMCRALVAMRPAGTASLAELNASLEARFHKAFGEDGQDWVVCSNSMPLAKTDVMCAMPRTLVEQIEQACKSHHLRVESMRPLWVWCAMESALIARKKLTWLVVGDGHAITAALFDGRTCAGIRTVHTEAPDELQAVLARNGLLFEDSHDAKNIVLWGDSVAAEKALLPEDVNLALSGWPTVWQGGSAPQRRRGGII